MLRDFVTAGGVVALLSSEGMLDSTREKCSDGTPALQLRCDGHLSNTVGGVSDEHQDRLRKLKAWKLRHAHCLSLSWKRHDRLFWLCEQRAQHNLVYGRVVTSISSMIGCVGGKGKTSY